MASTEENNQSTPEITQPPDDTPLVIPLDAGATVEDDGRTCKYCKKTFKKQAQYDVHALKQPCLNPQFRTNCLVCNVIMASRDEYEKHVVSREHFNIVAGLTNRNFKWQPSSKNKTKQAAFTINYENDTTESFEVAAEEEEEEQNITQSAPPAVTEAVPPMPTRDEIRKRQIINHLDKIKTSGDPGGTFYKLLSKLTLPDYDGLYICIAREPSLSDVEKKFFIGVIIKFIRDLEVLLQKGTATFENKDIRQIIVNLSNKKR